MDASNLAVGSGMHWQLCDCQAAGIGYRLMVSEKQLLCMLLAAISCCGAAWIGNSPEQHAMDMTLSSMYSGFMTPCKFKTVKRKLWLIGMLKC